MFNFLSSLIQQTSRLYTSDTFPGDAGKQKQLKLPNSKEDTNTKSNKDTNNFKVSRFVTRRKRRRDNFIDSSNVVLI